MPQLDQERGAQRIRERVEERDRQPGRAVEEAELQDIRAEELERRAHDQRQDAPARAALEAVLRGEARVEERLLQGVVQVAVGVMANRRREALDGAVDEEAFVHAAPPGAEPPRAAREAELPAGIPRPVADRRPEERRATEQRGAGRPDA